MRFFEYLKRFTYTPNEFYDYLMGIEDLIYGDIDALVVAPPMTGAGGDEQAVTLAPANAKGYTQEVVVKIVNSNGDVIQPIDGKVLEVTLTKSSAAGTIKLNGETYVSKVDLEFVRGVCAFTVELGGTWAADDYVKVSLSTDAGGLLTTPETVTDHYLIKVVTPDE
jgi:hypothetical protein